MCLSPEAYVAARVVERLLAAGVTRQRAEGVGRKVARGHALKRREAAVRFDAPLDRRHALRDIS